ncbi:MAG: TonB-dependent receptor [Gammaproteobacteria bacterium]|nr:TonB-dependent receptor [Gammaproteobacteria bacterium]
MLIKASPVLIIGLLNITNVFADDLDFFSMSLTELMQVEVYTASQENEQVARSPAAISIITAQQIQEWGITNIHDAISLLPGIVKSETYIGQTTQTFRGVTPGLFNNKSLYLINGHPSYESLFGSTLLDYVPIEIVERIEVVRSPASVLYGTNSISGVINIITRQGKENNDQLTFRAGSNSHIYGSLVHHSENFSMAASVQRDDGYDYSATNDEFGNAVDLDYRYDIENVFVDSFGDDWRIHGAIFDREKAMYGINPWTWQNGTFENFVGYLDANKKYNIKTGELNFWLRYDLSDKDIHVNQFPFPASSADCSAFNISIPTPAGSCDDSLSNASTVINKVERYSLEAQFKDKITESLNYIVGGTIEQQKSTPLLFTSDLDGSTTSDAFAENHETNTAAIYTQIKYQMNDNTLFIAGVRAENNSENAGSGIMPKLGLTYQLMPETYIKVLYSEAFRSPMFIERYVNLNNVLMGDPDLERETIKTFEIGIDSQINEQNKLQLAVYTLNLENEILRVPLPAPSQATFYENGEGKKMNGLEIEWKSILNKQLELIINAAYVDGEDKSINEKDAPLIANKTLNTILSYHITKNLNTTLTAQYVGEKDVISSITSERSTLDSYQLINFITNYKIDQHSVKLIFNNITDERYTYPEPVRRRVNDVPGGIGFSTYAQYQYSF